MSRRALGALVVLLAVFSGACKEEREPNTGPNTTVLDGDNLFFTALISTSVYRFQNSVAEFALRLVEAGETNAQIVPSCVGSGEMIARPVGPMQWQFVFDNFGIDCETILPLTINSDTCQAGGLFIRFEEISPGVRYTMSMPLRTEIRGEDAFGNQITRVTTSGMVYQLPNEFGNAILAITTPGQLVRGPDGRLIEEVINPNSDCELRFARTENDFITCELEPSAGRHAGFVHQSGTVRIEDRTQGFLIVQELQLEYAYDDEALVRFSPWPTGFYEIALFASIGFGGSISSLPNEVVFDGAGGATFEYTGLQCDVNFLTLQNPCADL